MLRHLSRRGAKSLAAEVRHRCLASTSSVVWQEAPTLASPLGKGKERAVDDGKEEDSEGGDGFGRTKSIYEHSRASSRPRPNVHTPLFAAKRSGSRARLLSKSLQNGESSLDVDMGEGREELRSASAFDDVLARTDSKLRELYSAISVRRADKNLAGVIDVCADIQQRLHEIAAERKLPSIPPPSLHVYHCLLYTAAECGQVRLCQSTLEDMRALGFDIDVDLLNYRLKASIVASDRAGIEEVLDEIASLSPLWGSTASESLSAKNEEEQVQEQEQEEQNEAMPVLISRHWTRNWTPKTYHHMLLRCTLTHNLELALALLGCASQTKGHGVQEEGEARQEDAFLARVLNPATCLNLLSAAAHCREARLMTDLALWMDDGASMRKLDSQMWMSVLRCSADNDWFPGVEVAWDRAVRKALLTPDEGLVVQILNTASRVHGQALFIQEILSLFFDVSPASSSVRSPRAMLKKWALQEWHLAPLFESQCADLDFEAAFRTANRIASLSAGVATPTHHTLKSLTRFASSSPEAMEKAYAAFKAVGAEQTTYGGMLTGSLNAMIAAANRLTDKALAVQIYRDRKYLRDARKDPLTASVPAPPTPEEEPKEDYETWGGKKLKRPGLDRAMFTMSRQELADTVLADAATFDELLLTAIDARDRLMGTLVFKDLNHHRRRTPEEKAAKIGEMVTPTATTYERAIILCLTQKGYYEDAFKFLEEAKRRKIVPTRTSYEAIVLRCRDAGDERWERIARELRETGQRPSRMVERWLREIDGEDADTIQGEEDNKVEADRKAQTKGIERERKTEGKMKERRQRFRPKQNLYKRKESREGEEERWE
ncbi:hypothetical protein FA10DRAFT_167943 [Acaromyces ingoldii]|uniref:Pentatricopeptide repeat-containing protein-mitochondrial domain-containing protein n=1 Tax=Acaromyces ingoldii TaxID=215250 RepID=A0A316YLM7_9BASI|nr:hypothetical protein FA10DRAFT_167943 [Acaromyces ingoldii]PWN88625.1 hypothetical protein FA10DRAFT_167943 [Acaromyces ingoldii]